MLILAKNDRTDELISITLSVSNYMTPTWSLRPIIIGYRVRFVDHKIEGDKTIGGENYYAAKEFGLDYPYSPNVVLIVKQHPGRTKQKKRMQMLKTIAHEIIEAEIMSQGVSYECAHDCANSMDDEVVEIKVSC